MRHAFVHGLAVAIGLSLVSLSWNTSANAADRRILVDPSGQNVSAGDIVEYEGPNRELLVSGLLTFTVPYLASLGVGLGSQHPGDQHLVVPVAGPWMNLNERPKCIATRENCETETTNKILLVGDGVLQGLGALQLVAAFLFPEREIVATTISKTRVTPEFRLSPAKIGGTGYGLSAVGTF